MRLLKPLLYQLYLLQLENYSLRGFWRLLRRKVVYDFFGSRSRHSTVWTGKAKIIFLLAVILAGLSAWSQSQTFAHLGEYMRVLIILGYFLLYANLLGSIFLTLAVIVFWPVDWLVKTMIVARAKRKLAEFPNLKIIAITGSFGKTTMKECLASVLSVKYKILKTPENINTPVGISRLIMKSLSQDTEIFIVEMGANHKHDIRELCKLTQPDISILTGINEAHLETFKTIENTIETKFEIVKFAKVGAIAVLNADNDLVKKNFERFSAGKKIKWYKDQGSLPFNITPSILGGFVSGVFDACVIVAKELGMQDADIKQGLEDIKPVEHRLQLIKNNNGVTVIDDSYNGNPAGVAEAIRVLKKYPGTRKVFITPGLVEMGSENESVHRKIGEQLAGNADLVILIRNSATPFISEGLLAKGFSSSQILWFESAIEAHASLSSVLKSGDVVLFQNDWPDNYV